MKRVGQDAGRDGGDVVKILPDVRGTQGIERRIHAAKERGFFELGEGVELGRIGQVLEDTLRHRTPDRDQLRRIIGVFRADFSQVNPRFDTLVPNPVGIASGDIVVGVGCVDIVG